MKKIVTLSILAIFAIIAGFYLTLFANRLSQDNSHLTTSVAQGAPAVWASSADSVAKVFAEADLVARVKVTADPTPRTVSFGGPMLAEDGTEIGEAVDKITFLDTPMNILEVYKGTADGEILVMQTGSMGQGADGNALQASSLEGDPLYIKGGEYLLFLVDISDDPIHAQGRALYRIVNPAGRYTVDGVNVWSEPEFTTINSPKTMTELLQQIQLAQTDTP